MSISDLARKTCVPCEGGVPPLKGDELKEYEQQLPGWQVVEGHHIVRDFNFPDFKSALAFVNQVGDIAEAEGHHPEIKFTWGKARVSIWTHKVNGLTESDFILAAKISKIAST
jgi:4a-hydroxytetrahydrobiopterin dehydratase